MQATERDIAAVVLIAAGFGRRRCRKILLLSQSSGKRLPPANPVEKPNERPVASTPVLDSVLGRDLTRAAIENQLVPILGRDDEIQLVIETLCRRSKRQSRTGWAGRSRQNSNRGSLAQPRCPGFSSRNSKGSQDCCTSAIQTWFAGASMSGELEKRMQNIIKEASQEGIILFIAEIHSVMGRRGLLMGSSDIASILKAFPGGGAKWL